VVNAKTIPKTFVTKNCLGVDQCTCVIFIGDVFLHKVFGGIGRAPILFFVFFLLDIFLLVAPGPAFSTRLLYLSLSPYPTEIPLEIEFSCSSRCWENLKANP
jgi:hypothetical protein